MTISLLLSIALLFTAITLSVTSNFDVFLGSHCETEVDECDMDPCQNGGTCTDLIGRFQCDCFPQYYGATCELQNGCFDQVCLNVASCHYINVCQLT